MVNLVLRLLGLGSAVDALDGETSKAYIGGVGLILSGAASIFGGAANLLAEIVPLHGASAYLSFAQGLQHDPNSALILAGAALISKGIAEIGQRHATAKLANAVAAASPVPVPAPSSAPTAAPSPSATPAP